ncbi:MAG: bifunctional glutamate N-acetyltransferase/amino-acid acetyltransferase ArgJ [Bacillota bacterium]
MKKQNEWVKLENRGVTAAKGFQASGISGGIKKDKKDIGLIYSENEAQAAGVFTLNLVQAAPVHLCKAHLENPIQALIINSGNANACTGEQGKSDTAEMAEKTASVLGLDPNQVMVSSTGVIGVPLPMDKINSGIDLAVSALGKGLRADADAAEAILTTDTVIKQSAYGCSLPEGDFHVAGMAKGSGMICPNMATMLAFLVTDVKIERSLLQNLFSEAADNSFNAITVDGETSTNDTALILANGAAEGIEITPDSESLTQFKEMLNQVCRELALQIVEDGEGLTKVITLSIKGAVDKPSARVLARTVLNSPLVKTAFYGEDANWGRIIAALGYAGIDFDPARVDIFIGPYQVAANGGAVPFSEEKMKLVLKNRNVAVTVDLKIGPAEVKVWGTDMSHEYISINSNYRT